MNPEGTSEPEEGRIAVGVSGAGSNLRALAAAAERGELGGRIVLVFADRACPALDWAAEQGIETALVPAAPAGDERRPGRGGRRARRDAPLGWGRPRRPRRLHADRRPADAGGVPRPDPQHPSGPPARLPRRPRGPRRAGPRGALTGATVHLVDATLDGGPIVAQEAVPVLPDDDEATLHARIQAVEHRLLPRAVALALAGALGHEPGATRTTVDVERAEARIPRPRRALLSVSDKTGLVDLGRRLVGLGFELVSTGGTARALRDAGLPVTDVAAVTGFPEMLDGRVKTLHPRVHGGILADRRLVDHRRQLVAAAIAPFELVVVNLYPFAAAAERPGITFDELVEEIDIGGPSMVRAAAKNHASVAIVTSPTRYEAVLAALEGEGSVPARPSLGTRRRGVPAHRRLRRPDRRRAARPDGRRRDRAAGRARAAGRVRSVPVDPGRSGSRRSRRSATARTRTSRRPATGAPARPRPTGRSRPGAAPLQGKALSYNNVLDASAVAALARSLRGPGCVIVKHTNPCGAAERPTLLEAWEAALAGDPVSAFGGVVGLTGRVDRTLAEALTAIFLEVVVAPGFDEDALAVLGAKPNLRLLVDPTLGREAATAPAAAVGAAPDPLGSIRTAGGAVLVTAPDTASDDPATWTTATSRAPTPAETRDLDLAWRLARGVTSNAIVLVRDGRLVGLGSGQTSRVDAARQAVDKARTISGADALIGAACGSDAFYPFPDAVEVCLAAGVTAFAQPGGSVRDDDVIAVAEAAGATMVLTGTRHFRH